ncbi:carbohydrate-binding module family 48 protein, partial [Stipitochalara longipes BDJ]
MRPFVFRWEHPASEVFVTGTFDNWSKSEKLIQIGDVFEKEVALPITTEKIYYKFVVDGRWVTNDTAPQETDDYGIPKNVLT